MLNSASSYTEMAGIIGGIGSEATSYFVSLIVKLRQQYAKNDQGHIPFLLFNNPQIPDRTDYLLKKSNQNPIHDLVETGLVLKKAGATFLVMPCNTAHAFVQVVKKEVGLPFINMIEETTSYIQRTYGDNATVGVLATTGTLHSQLYQQSFNRVAKNITVLLPDGDEQSKIMEAIYDIKSNSVNEGNTQILYSAANKLVSKGASIIILGCTEIPLALKAGKGKFFRIDPMEILAQKVIERTILSVSDKQSVAFIDRNKAYANS